ncbi:MAG: uL15 family ribosomal protein [Nitrososphaerota archaeon]|nr:uL15 family ribosomal protein [Candidatus Calditenuaceae archaeon]MDW8072751.1 uL15 family ribosomal protein [Nitrososphaerota archaeon]
MAGARDKLLKAKVRRLARRSRFWAAVLKALESSSRRGRVLNIYQLNRVAPSSGGVLVIGKLLGLGVLERPLKVVAFDFSETAFRKILEAGGEAYYLEEYIERGGDGRGLVIVG